MRSRKGQTPESRVRCPTCMVVPLVALAALVLFARCDWLLNMDVTAPACAIASPADSSAVNGVVTIAATATDSSGVDHVTFYADATVVGTDTTSPYSATWDASGLAEGTWHSLYCTAHDLAGNKGYSDTIAVEIAGAGQTSVYHGELDVPARGHKSVWLDASADDTLAGDAQVVSGGTLSSFIWLDNENHQKYVAGQTYTALFQQDSFSQMSMRQAVASSGRFYIVFANTGNAVIRCWARFVLE